MLDCLRAARASTRPTARASRSSRSRCATTTRIDAVGQLLFDRGVYVTLAAYPLVPKDEVGFRVQLTAANTDAEVDMLIAALEELAERGELAAAEHRTPG